MPITQKWYLKVQCEIPDGLYVNCVGTVTSEKCGKVAIRIKDVPASLKQWRVIYLPIIVIEREAIIPAIHVAVTFSNSNICSKKAVYFY